MAIPQPDVDYATFSIADVPSAPEPFRLANRVPIVDNGEPLVDLRETNPEFSFNDYCLPYVREGVAEALRIAIQRLPEAYDLRIFTALRTHQQQADMYWGNYNRAKEAHPNWPESVLRRMTNRFFAPPDAKAPPGHSTGGAVDVGLHCRNTGKPLDMRSPLEGWKGAPTAVEGLGEEAAENRRLLCYLMYSTGLSNCRDEFWHWSYGDSAWAVRVGAKTACYGLIEAPPDATRVIGEKVEVKPYDPEWPNQFEQIRQTLAESLDGLVIQLEHFGSTSVPGMRAKPILDIVVVLASSESFEPVKEVLAAMGYEYQGDRGIEGREAFRPKSDDASKELPSRTWPKHRLYACVEGSRELLRQRAFRDHLRANQVAAAEYEQLKWSLAARYPWDRTRYQASKAPFIGDVLRTVDPSLVDTYDLAGALRV